MEGKVDQGAGLSRDVTNMGGLGLGTERVPGKLPCWDLKISASLAPFLRTRT